MNMRTIGVISVLLNLGLLAAVGIVYTKDKASSSETTSVKNAESKPRFGRKFAKTSALKQNNESIDSATDEFSWSELESQDFKAYIANLRSIECPEETIRDIIVADVNKLYAPKLQKIRGADEPSNYWKGNRNSGRNYYAEQQAIRAIEKEKSNLLIELLGVDPNTELKKEGGYFDYQDRNFEFLSEDRREKLREIAERHDAKKQEIYRNAIWDDEDRKKIRDIEDEKLAEMAQSMTPQELEDYQLRASQTASQLRYDLEGFSPSENEFREIFRIKKSHENEYASDYDPEDKAAQEQRKKIQEQTDAEAKGVLGESRFAEYKRAQDYNYKELARLTDRLELPKEAAATVYDLKKESEKAANQIRTNQTLTAAQRTDALKQIREEAERTALTALGETGLKKYKSRSGWWFNNISPENKPK